MNIFKEEITFSLKDKIMQLMQDLIPDFNEDQWGELFNDLSIIFAHDLYGEGTYVSREAYKTAFDKWFNVENFNHSKRYLQEKAQEIMQLFEAIKMPPELSDTIHYQSPGVYAPQVLNVLQDGHELPANINCLLVGAQNVLSIDETIALLESLGKNYRLTVSDIAGEETVDYVKSLHSTNVQFLLDDILNPKQINTCDLILTSNLLDNLVKQDTSQRGDPIEIAITNMVENLKSGGIIVMQESSALTVLNMVEQSLERLGKKIAFRIYNSPIGFKHREFLNEWEKTGIINPDGIGTGSQYDRKMVVIEVVKL